MATSIAAETTGINVQISVRPWQETQPATRLHVYKPQQARRRSAAWQCAPRGLCVCQRLSMLPCVQARHRRAVERGNVWPLRERGAEFNERVLGLLQVHEVAAAREAEPPVVRPLL